DILNHLFEDGILVGGNSPVSYLSAMLYHSPDFQSHGRKGWTLKLPAAEPPEEKAVDAEPTGDASTALDQPEAQGREAGPGGGA
ncbi:MAG: hypothetical protein AB7P20_13665, partial [Rhizobiaceae bacterium]